MAIYARSTHPLYATINGLQYRREGFHLLKEYVSQYMPAPPVDYFAGRPSGSADAHPGITVLPGTVLDAATAIHQQIHHVCFIARSVNFPVS
ncbi:hypothetical protein [Klebsiella quasipneumoniae]|uniref:hypothetical protein n=1 Tax=Klebsiella quasipneumoniae TaxID=1463165 RepID=UPI0020A6396C|nr:hypothetical protein [Klebsiella quasipneumoniae]